VSETTEADKLEEAIDLIEPCFVPMGPGGDVDAIEVVRAAARRELARMREAERPKAGPTPEAISLLRSLVATAAERQHVMSETDSATDALQVLEETLAALCADRLRLERLERAKYLADCQPAAPLEAIATLREALSCPEEDIAEAHERGRVALSELESFVKAVSR
jgi:hypothetical protein